ncbi:MAG: STAS domain-containing protein [Candidatus Sumerlaeota bacterium]
MLEIAEREEHVVLYPSGYLNGATGKELVEASERLSREGWNRILIHFGRIETINTMGVAGLVSVLEKVPRRGGEVSFCDLGATNREMLDVLNISSAVLIFDSENAAVEHWKKVGKAT